MTKYDFAIQNVAGDRFRFCVAGVMKRFGYLRDRLFCISLAVYALNRLVVRPHLGGFFHTHCHWLWPFLHSHLDDFLLMPVALPVVLWMQRRLGLRKNDCPPSWAEMFFHCAVWSVMSKIVGPLLLNVGVADPWDVLFFFGGGAAACLWWQRCAWRTAIARP